MMLISRRGKTGYKKICKLKFALFIVLTFGLMFLSIFSGIKISDSKVYAEADESRQEDAIDLDEEISNKLGKTIRDMNYLRFPDGDETYMCINFNEGGYGVFYKDTFEMLEYSPIGSIPVLENNEMYYCGPQNFYIKENDQFINVVTKERKNICSEEIERFKEKTQEMFKKEISENDRKTNAAKPYTRSKNTYPSVDENSLIVVDDYTTGTYIENFRYFLQNPKHGDNTSGTCGSVASQLLLTYNNYYNDRRIITNGSYLNSDNPNTYSDPGAFTAMILGSSNDYYSYIQGYVEIGNCSTYTSIYNGLTSILNGTSVSYNLHKYEASSGSIGTYRIQTEINNNRPTIVGMSQNLGGSNHWVVAYGYKNYTYPNEVGTYSGYVVHYGWGDTTKSIWINSAWCDGCITLSINHTHSYDNYVGGNYNEIKCSTCNHRTYAYTTNILTVDKVEIVDTLEQTLIGSLTIPSKINGRRVTSIGNMAFDAQTNITSVSLPSYLEEIGEGAFANCSNLTGIYLPSTVTQIGECAFLATAITSVSIPSGVTEIPNGVFGITPLTSVTINGDVTHIRATAFYYCANLNSIELPNSVISIENYVFANCQALSSITIKNSAISIGYNAFKNCNNLTIYTSKVDSTGWDSAWNASNRPVVWGCTLSSDSKYVVSFNKTSSNPSNATAPNGMNNPTRSGYTFGGWYTTSDYSGTKYDDIASAPNGTLYAKWTSSSCIAAGSLITLADGSQVAVENLTGNENLLVWNMLTGQYDTAPILFIDSDPLSSYEIIKLTFSDNTEVKVIDEHAFFDMTIGEYVFMRNDASQYIGHYFNKQGINGTYTTVQLINVTVYKETTTAWSPVTYGHLCYYVNGMLSMPGGTEGLINIFDVDTSLMQYDEEQKEEDILTYGLYTYEEFNAIIPLPELVFNAFNGQYLKVSIGKGLITLDEIEVLLERYAAFFE